MHEQILIRAFNKNDKSEVSLLFRTIFNEMGWKERTSDYLGNPIKSFLSTNGELFVVVSDKKIIATSGIVPLDNSTVLLKRFYLLSKYRNNGIADKLLDFTLQDVKARNYKTIVLDVTRENLRAIHFYKKHHFTEFKPFQNQLWDATDIPGFFYFYKKDL